MEKRMESDTQHACPASHQLGGRMRRRPARRTSGSPRLGAGSNCRKFFRMPSSTSMMAAMLPARARRVTRPPPC